MTIQEAYNWLTQPGIKALMPVDPQTQDAIDEAIKALEKQIPQKPNDKYTNDKTYHTYTCPVCGWEFYGEFINYCYMCGIKFDWSNTDE